MRITLDGIIQKAAGKSFMETEVAAFCAEYKLTQDEFIDAVSQRVATRYHLGELDFTFCDQVMNTLFAFTTMGGEHEMPPYAFSVFLAFDDGEYCHSQDPRDSDPEQLYTRPAIAKISDKEEKST